MMTKIKNGLFLNNQEKQIVKIFKKIFLIYLKRNHDELTLMFKSVICNNYAQTNEKNWYAISHIADAHDNKDMHAVYSVELDDVHETPNLCYFYEKVINDVIISEFPNSAVLFSLDEIKDIRIRNNKKHICDHVWKVKYESPILVDKRSKKRYIDTCVLYDMLPIENFVNIN